MSNRNRGHSIDAFYHPSVHLNKRFRGEESKKSANQKQESPVAAMFVTDRDRMSNLYTKFRFIWPRGFREEEF
jgi:hypothetical protein